MKTIMRSTGMALLLAALLAGGGCATAVMAGAGQGGRAADGRSYQAARADNTISARINRLFVHDPRVPATAIRVETYNGVVTLSGRVPRAAVARRAVAIARGVPGVRRVVDRLRIGR